jgi:hypothetical protein
MNEKSDECQALDHDECTIIQLALSSLDIALVIAVSRFGTRELNCLLGLDAVQSFD